MGGGGNLTERVMSGCITSGGRGGKEEGIFDCVMGRCITSVVWGGYGGGGGGSNLTGKWVGVILRINFGGRGWGRGGG